MMAINKAWNVSMEGIDKWLTLVKVFDNPFDNERSDDVSSWAWRIERWAIMCDTWEIME